jgi:hypothetical protein
VSDVQRRQVGYVAWRVSVLAVLALAGAWDAAGLLVGGDAVYTSHSYDLLRRLTPWGMRVYGPALAVLVVAAVYAFGRHAGRHTTARSYVLLRGSLAALAGWYTLWAVGICGGWWLNGQIVAWGSVGKLLLTSTLCIILARTTPTSAPPLGR